jgi:septum formation protein
METPPRRAAGRFPSGLAGLSEVSRGAALLGIRGEPLILASLSPRRRELLRMLQIRYEAVVPEVFEGDRGVDEPAERYVERLAEAKAQWVPREIHGYAVLAADTVVCLDADVLEKPVDEDHARQLLRRLSGRWHEVYTGVCLRRIGDERMVVGHECSRVLFSRLSDAEIAGYVTTGEPMDKAGAYGIQGFGGLLIERIEGCYFNVMGLPLARLRRLAHELEDGA